MEINGNTKLFALIGHPVEHSFSPGLHNPQLKLNEINGRYLAFDVEPENLEAALKGISALGIMGANITVPYKEKVIPFLKSVSREAELIGAVNTLIPKEDGFHGENTDGRGFLESLKEEKGFLPEKKKIVIIGAGGAARGVGVTLALAGASEISFLNRTWEKAEVLKKLIEINTNAQSYAWDYQEKSIPSNKVLEADLIINATNIGMFPETEYKPELDYNLLHSDQLVADLIYNPEETLFLKEAARRGAGTINGRGMLYYQGALAFRLWTGKNFK